MTRRRVVTPSRVDADVSPADGAGVDAFGRIRTSEPTNRFDVEFTHDLQPLLVDAITAGGFSPLGTPGWVEPVSPPTGWGPKAAFRCLAIFLARWVTC